MNMIHSKKAVGPIGAIMLFCMFLIIYFVWLANWISYVGTDYITKNSATGFEAFFYSNLNLWIIIIMILAMLGWAYYGGQQ